MKAPTKKQSANGFTLVELLVVIAIIAVLASAGFGVGIAAKEKAKRLSAQAGATAIVSAIEQFYTEYSALPNVGEGTPIPTDGDGLKVLNILAGKETVADPENPRKIKFLSYKQAKNDMDGIKYNDAGTEIENMFDPWGQPFFIVMDNEPDPDGYDERLTFTPTGNPAVTLNGRKAAVYSLGVKNSADASPSKLVKTW